MHKFEVTEILKTKYFVSNLALVRLNGQLN